MLILVIPWVIKPLYGLISDFFPILGYRSYLVLVNLVTSASCFWLATLADPVLMKIPLFLISLGTAASSALCQAVMVENGKLTGLTGKFVSQQWLWFSVAGMIVLPLGGFLFDHFGPLAGLHGVLFLPGAAAPQGEPIRRRQGRCGISNQRGARQDNLADAPRHLFRLPSFVIGNRFSYIA